MKTFGKILMVLLAVIAAFVILFNVNDDVWYETHVQVIRVLGKEDGLYCLTPYTCVGVIHEYENLYNANQAYIDEYGYNAPGRPMHEYKYNSDMHAYVRWYNY